MSDFEHTHEDSTGVWDDLALRLAVAYKSYIAGIGMDYCQKTYPVESVGKFWHVLAEFVWKRMHSIR